MEQVCGEQPYPVHPLLSIEELEELHDLSDELPPDLDWLKRTLRPDDIVVKIETPEIKGHEKMPFATPELLRLCGAAAVREIGLHGPAAAGLPSKENAGTKELEKFGDPHGRDSLEIALKLAKRYPELLRATIRTLAEKQGLYNEEYQDGIPFGHEQPGAIILVDKDPDDEVGQKFSRFLNWRYPFYGSIDAPATFVSAIVRYAEIEDAFLEEEYTGKDGEVYKIEDALERSVGWLLARMDENAEGLVEFCNRDPAGGMDSQAWKDSAYAYIHKNGERANHKKGIASIEVQALAYDALCDAADLYENSRSDMAAALRERAQELKSIVLDSFWVEDEEKGGYFALATDRGGNDELRPLAVRTSNMGRLLNSRILEGEDAREKRDIIVRHLFSEAMLAPAGVRTLANDEAAFQEGGYHTGSVWLWDSAYVADGLERQGMPYLAWELRERMWNVVNETGIFPEFVNGGSSASEMNKHEVYIFNEKDNALYVACQPPQECQGWTVSALLEAKYKYKEWLQQKESIMPTDLEREILSAIKSDPSMVMD